jgi:hypothetical protein
MHARLISRKKILSGGCIGYADTRMLMGFYLETEGTCMS